MTHDDCLIWIGRSYPTVADFVREARELGCCRQVPFWPAWLGKGSRVFLAHRDDRKEPQQGVVFGYFELGGVDVILHPKDHDRYRACTTAKQKIAFWKKRRPHGLPGLTEFILDFLLCGDAGSGHGFGYGISTDLTSLTRARDCGEDGLRTGPETRGGDRHPTLYLVDGLQRELMLELCEVLKELLAGARKHTKKAAFLELRRRAKATLVKPHRQAGLPEFAKAVERVHARRGERGATSLVLFRSPYPMFARAPRASFRGMLRIDGDALLAQIRAIPAGQRGTIRIPYYDAAATTETAVACELARDFGWNRERAASVVDAIVDTLRTLGVADTRRLLLHGM